MHYEKSYLTQVIFSAIFSIDNLKNSIDPSLVALCEELTKSKISETRSTNITFIAGGKMESSNSPIWIFKGDDIYINIQSNSLQIVNLKYTTHTDYHTLIGKIFDLICSIYNPIISKVSFRYVNIISLPDGDAFDFKEYINPSLLNATEEFKSEGIARSIGAINIIKGDVVTNFTYGYFNSEFPNKIAKREFMLDFESSISITGERDLIKILLLKLSTSVNNLFEKSILEPLRIKMGKK